MGRAAPAVGGRARTPTVKRCLKSIRCSKKNKKGEKINLAYKRATPAQATQAYWLEPELIQFMHWHAEEKDLPGLPFYRKQISIYPNWKEKNNTLMQAG